MLRSLKDLERYIVSATDGNVGSVVDFLLDDENWTIRYLVVDAGNWLGGRQVLISPVSFREAAWSDRHFHVALSRAQVQSAPNVEVDLPVSRQRERDYHDHYGYPYYWAATGMGLKSGLAPPPLPTPPAVERTGDVHLRSAKELRGYHIQGTDDAIGHVNEFIVDDETWEVRYLVIDTSNWWIGKKVLLAPHWARRVSWLEGKVYVDLDRETIKGSPAWNGVEAINREYETQLHEHYQRSAYWAPAGASKPESGGGPHP